jgi:hypothetical protein
MPLNANHRGCDSRPKTAAEINPFQQQEESTSCMRDLNVRAAPTFDH